MSVMGGVPTPAGRAEWMVQAAWASVVALLTAFASQGLFVAAIALGMLVVVGFDLGETLGVPVYWSVLIGAALAYWLLLHCALRGTARATRLPRVIWPAMLVAPVAQGVVWLIAPGLAEIPFAAIIGIVGPVGAWFTVGRGTWNRG